MGAPSSMKRAYSWAYALAFVLLVLAFAADSATTEANGHAMLSGDRNPTVRALSPEGYLLWSVVRLAAALTLLTVFWPERLVLRRRWASCSPLPALLFPLSYGPGYRYLVPAALVAIAPMKLGSAASNLYLLTYGREPLGFGPFLCASIVSGILVSNAVLYWHYVLSQGDA